MVFIVHWNCRGLIHNLGDIKDIINKFSPVAICLQETNLGAKNTHFLKGFTVVRKDREHSSRLSGGVAIVVQGGTPTRYIKLNTSLEAVAVTVLAHKTITICSLYVPPHQHITALELHGLTAQLPKPFVLVGDFNAHCTLWGSEKTDKRGQLIEDFILSNNICLLNTSSPTYFSPSSRKFSCLDLAFCSPSLFTDLNWEVLDNPYGSDHLPAIINLTSKLPTITTKPRRWLVQRADWLRFKENVNLEEAFSSNLNINEINEKFTAILIAAAEKSIPQSSNKVRKKLKTWWTPECTDAKKLQNRAWGVFRRYPTYTNLVNFKQAKAKARYIRRQAEKSSWQNYISGINSSVTSKILWDKVRKFRGDYSPYTIPILTSPGTQTTLQEQADILGVHFYNVSSSANYSDTFLKYKQTAEKQRLPLTDPSNEAYNCPITSQELNSVLLKGKQTAVGPDRIHYAMLAHLSPASTEALLKFFNRIWESGIMPEQWKNAIVVPFLKSGKSPTSPSSYRPIALTSCLAKTYESIINIRLTFILYSRNLIDMHQCGYRKNCSTTDHLVRLEHHIREAFLYKQHCMAVFFDLEKAYDTTWRHGILLDLASLGIRGKMLNCLADFLTNRTFQVRLGTVLSRTFAQENGVPQGCILSTTLFIVKMNSINKAIPPTIMHSVYVDDLQIACRASSLSSCERQLQITINKLTKWADQNGFRFSTQKTTAVLFTQTRGVFPDPVLKLNNIEMQVKQEYKFLGITFDRKLNFLAHINTLKTKANKALNLLKVLSHKHWGSDRLCLLRIYRSVVRSIIDYGCVVYGSARDSYRSRLDPVHNLGLRLSNGAYRTSPVQSLYVDCNEPPLCDRRALLTMSYVLRIRSSPQHICYDIATKCKSRLHYLNKPNSIKPLILRFEECCRMYAIPEEALNVAKRPPRLPPWFDLAQLCDLSLSHLNKRHTPSEHLIQEFRALQDKYRDYAEYYTDGSKTENHVGIGIVTAESALSVRVPQCISIFTAEVYGLYEAVRKIIAGKYKKAIIYTDSLSALKALHVKSECEPLLGDILNMVFLNSEEFSIRFCWVPSHVGIPGNEKADEYASLAVHKALTKIKIPLKDSQRTIRRALLGKWQQQWDSCTNNKLHLVKPLLGEWKTCRHQERFVEVILCRLRIGHTHLTHNFLLTKEKQPICEKCEQPLTLIHILITCPDVETQRQKYFSKLYKEHIPLHPALLLGDHPLVPLSDVLNFLKEVDFLSKL